MRGRLAKQGLRQRTIPVRQPINHIKMVLIRGKGYATTPRRPQRLGLLNEHWPLIRADPNGHGHVRRCGMHWAFSHRLGFGQLKVVLHLGLHQWDQVRHG